MFLVIKVFFLNYHHYYYYYYCKYNYNYQYKLQVRQVFLEKRIQHLVMIVGLRNL